MTNNNQKVATPFPFSVAMSVYCKDNPIFLDRALQSITDKQKILPSEIVLVCDGPLCEQLDNTIRKYEKCYPIFNTIRLPENKGLGNALNIAVSNAKYDLVARMDSDDVSVSTRFEQQISFFLQHPEVDIVGGDITEFIDDEQNIVGKRCVPCHDAEIKEYMKTRAAFNHVSVMFKKKAVNDAGGYLDLFWNEDYYLWLRMQHNNAIFANTGTTLVNVRVGKDMYKRRGGKRYFNSELFLQKWMLDKRMIGWFTFLSNVTKRFILQLVLPSNVRGWVFRKFARRRTQ